MNYLLIGAAYLIGSFPTAYFAGRVVAGADIRCLGDGNMGAQNAARQLGLPVGVAVFVVDSAKGALAVLLARALGVGMTEVMLAGVAVMAGHNWPVFLGFRGGRGEATSIGILLVLALRPIIITELIALAVIYKTQNVTLGSAFLYILLFPLYWLVNVPAAIAAYSLGLALLVAFTHFIRVKVRLYRCAK